MRTFDQAEPSKAVDCHRKNAARAAQWELCAAERERLVKSLAQRAQRDVGLLKAKKLTREPNLHRVRLVTRKLVS